MADLPTPESQALDSEASQHDGDHHPSQRYEEYDYSQATGARIVPTTTELDFRADSDDKRPGTAGTAHSTEHNFDHYSDVETVVARCSVAIKQSATQPMDAPESEGHVVLVRPETPQPAEGYIPFSRADQHLVTSTPHRSTQPSNAMPTPLPTDDDTEVQHHHTRPAHQPDRSERRRKKTKARRAQPQIFQEDAVVILDDATTGRDIVPDAHADGSGIESPTFHAQQATDLDQEQSMGDHEASHGVQQSGEASPHVQLQHEFEAAADSQHQLSDGSSVIMMQVSQHNEDVHEAEEPSAGDEVDIQPPQDHHWSTSRSSPLNPKGLTHSTVQKRKSKSSRKAAPIRQEQSTATRTWKTSDYVELLKFKIEEEQQARMAAFAAEVEVLKIRVHTATEARNATQTKFDSVLKQKVALNNTIKEQNAKISKYEDKFHGFKRFVDGLGKDLDSLQKDATSQRRRMDDIAQDVETQNRRKAAAYLELDERAKDCRKFKDRALKIAADKDAELQQVLSREAELERDRDNAIRDFDKLRARCSDLEQQLTTIKVPSKELMVMLKLNHNALLDKLHLLHASTEETQEMNSITKLIERLDSASNMISSSTSATSEDISNIKALVEAVDER